MTGTKCNIKLCSKQKMGHESETTNEEYVGSFIDRGSKRYLSYNRVMPEGQKVDCLISFEHNKLTLTQKGDIQSKLEFATGARTRNAYNTPMGMMTIVVHTKRLVIEQKDKEINLLIDYDLEAGGEPINTVIEIKATLE
jgi:uncharacterized beta-barrel protein YwiB (DUF1934 family)